MCSGFSSEGEDIASLPTLRPVSRPHRGHTRRCLLPIGVAGICNDARAVKTRLFVFYGAERRTRMIPGDEALRSFAAARTAPASEGQ